jgi:hypothetical protein
MLFYRFKGGVCDKCGTNFLVRQKLVQHITSCIITGEQERAQNARQQSAYKSYFFKSEAAFDRWLEKMQFQTKTYFAKQSGTQQRSGHTKYKYLYCQHGRVAKNDFERKTNRRKKIGLLPYYACTARMSVNIRYQGTTVKFYSNHSHPLTDDSLMYQPFPVSLRKAVKKKISMGISSKVILQDLQSETSKWTSNETNKVSLLTQA